MLVAVEKLLCNVSQRGIKQFGGRIRRQFLDCPSEAAMQSVTIRYCTVHSPMTEWHESSLILSFPREYLPAYTYVSALRYLLLEAMDQTDHVTSVIEIKVCEVIEKLITKMDFRYQENLLGYFVCVCFVPEIHFSYYCLNNLRYCYFNY